MCSESFVVDDAEAGSARAGGSLNWEELEDRSLNSGGAKLRKVPRIRSRKCMNVEKIETCVVVDQ